MKIIAAFLLLLQLTYADIITLDEASGTGKIVFNVDKNIEKVMQEILDLESYPKKIEDVEKVEIYFTSTTQVNAKVYISSFFIDFHNSVVHEIDRKNHIVKWHLDKDEENYFKKMQGFWALKDINNTTQVTYQNQLKFKGWIPSFFKTYLLEKGLNKSTMWIRDDSF